MPEFVARAVRRERRYNRVKARAKQRVVARDAAYGTARRNQKVKRQRRSEKEGRRAQQVRKGERCAQRGSNEARQCQARKNRP